MSFALSAYRGVEESWRLDRLRLVLRHVIDEVGAEIAGRYLLQLHDHKGALSARVLTGTPIMLAESIRCAWEGQGEGLVNMVPVSMSDME